MLIKYYQFYILRWIALARSIFADQLNSTEQEIKKGKLPINNHPIKKGPKIQFHRPRTTNRPAVSLSASARRQRPHESLTTRTTYSSGCCGCGLCAQETDFLQITSGGSTHHHQTRQKARAKRNNDLDARDPVYSHYRAEKSCTTVREERMFLFLLLVTALSSLLDHPPLPYTSYWVKIFGAK